MVDAIKQTGDIIVRDRGPHWKACAVLRGAGRSFAASSDDRHPDAGGGRWIRIRGTETGVLLERGLENSFREARDIQATSPSRMDAPTARGCHGRNRRSVTSQSSTYLTTL